MQRIPLYLALVASLAPGLLGAQTSGFPDRFSTVQECSAAVTAGQYTVYRPSRLNPVKLKKGEKTIPIEHVACAHMHMVGGWAWGAEPVGSRFDFKGSKPARFTECGNDVDAIVYPPTTAILKPLPVGVTTIHDTSTRYVCGDMRATNYGESLPCTYPVTEEHNPNWFQRNWPWAAPLGAALVYAGIKCATDWCRVSAKSTSNSCSTTGSAQACTSTAIMQSRGFSFPIRIP